MTDEELIADMAVYTPLQRRRDGDDVARYGGGLLERAADRLEDRTAPSPCDGDLPGEEE